MNGEGSAALTEHEWQTLSARRGVLEIDGNPPLSIDHHGDGVTIHEPDALHALAALCLHRQAFGFTTKDVEDLRWAAHQVRAMHLPVMDVIGYVAPDDRLEALANRIAALVSV